MDHINIKVNVTDPDFFPKQATPSSVGFDFKSPEDFTFESFKPYKINLGFRLDMPDDTFCQLNLRSSIGSKGVILLANTIDPDYKNDIFLSLMCLAGEPISFKKGQRIGQLIFSKRLLVQLTEGQVRSTERGGFGSTGF